MGYNTCDRCRRRKAKCAPTPSGACGGCVAAAEACTFEIGYKKAGRRPRYSETEGRRTPGSTSGERRVSVEPRVQSPRGDAPPVVQEAGPSNWTGTSMAGPRPQDGISPESMLSMLADSGHVAQPSPLWQVQDVSPMDVLHSTPQGNQPAPENQPAREASPHIAFPSVSIDRTSQAEDVAPWPVLSFFLALYLEYMHSLFPVVHKPALYQAIAMRADKTNRNTRALILALVAYTIGQSPLSRMEPAYSRHELARLQRRCHRASLVFLDRGYEAVTLPHVAVMIANYFCAQSMGQTNLAQVYLAEACQLVHLVRMRHASHPDEADSVQRELYCRVFWHVYAVDITEAAAGNMIHLHDYDGLAPLPLIVDDELLTSQGAFEQPATKLSYMAGFNGCVQLFPILAECLIRHRRLRLHLDAGGGPPAGDDLAVNLAFADAMQRRIDEHIAAMPRELQEQPPQGEGADKVVEAVHGMQRANILVTEASVRLALYDFVADLDPLHSPEQRSDMSRRAYATLSSIPLEHLAANGESIRGKIFRIVVALLRSPDMDADWADVVHDWWSLFSRINFVQLAPHTMVLDSAGASPVP